MPNPCSCVSQLAPQRPTEAHASRCAGLPPSLHRPLQVYGEERGDPPTWYRFELPAGFRLPTVPPGDRRCDPSSACNVSVPSACNVSVPSACNVSVPSACNVSVPSACNVSVPSACKQLGVLECNQRAATLRPACNQSQCSISNQRPCEPVRARAKRPHSALQYV
jgi:hypothetical protein